MEKINVLSELEGIDFLVKKVLELRDFGNPIISLEGRDLINLGRVRAELITDLVEKYGLIGQSHLNQQELEYSLKNPRIQYVVAEGINYSAIEEYERTYFRNPMARAYTTRNLSRENEAILGNASDGLYDVIIDFTL